MDLRTCFTGLTVVVFALCSFAAQAYREPTHRRLTEVAVSRSELLTVLQDLGINLNSEFPNSNSAPQTVIDLFRYGVEFEDSTVGTIRPVQHFYNPVSGQGLLGLFMSSPDWALAAPDSVSGQQFSYRNARQSFFAALTEPTEFARKEAFGRTFQTLGHVLHHLQDMAQPQHVRNDPHCDWFPCSLVGSGPSRYERWTNQVEVRSSLPTDPALIGYNIASSTFTSTFNSPRRFWHTVSPSQASPATGMGIAEFANRNFVSYGTNFDRPGLFPSPVPDPNKIQPNVDIQQDLCLNAKPSCPPGLHGKMTFYGNTVKDNFLGSSADKENPRASTLSTFDQDLINRGGTPRFSLNRFNFQAAHDFLIPRAVAYSAGMINYFFRGKIALVPDGTNAGTYLIKNLGSERMTGTFTLYYDYDDSNAGTVNNRQLLMTLPDITIEANSQLNIGTISVPTNPAPKNPGEYLLVFKGDMGAETAAQTGTGAVVGAVTNPFLIFAVDRFEHGGETGDETGMAIHMFIPEKFAQKFASNPASVSVQVGGLILSPMSLFSTDPFPCDSAFLSPCPVLRVDAGSGPAGPIDAMLRLSQNNQFDVRAGSVFFGNTPEDLRLISRDTLCGNAIESTDLEVGGYAPQSLVQIKLFFEGNVLFEFVVSPPPVDGGPVILTNVKGVRLTDVNCRVSIQ